MSRSRGAGAVIQLDLLAADLSSFPSTMNTLSTDPKAPASSGPKMKKEIKIWARDTTAVRAIALYTANLGAKSEAPLDMAPKPKKRKEIQFCSFKYFCGDKS